MIFGTEDWSYRNSFGIFLKYSRARLQQKIFGISVTPHWNYKNMLVLEEILDF